MSVQLATRQSACFQQIVAYRAHFIGVASEVLSALWVGVSVKIERFDQPGEDMCCGEAVEISGVHLATVAMASARQKCRGGSKFV